MRDLLKILEELALNANCEKDKQMIRDKIKELKTKTFPVRIRNEHRNERYVYITWEAALKAYDTYSGRYGKSQTLTRLAQRGGFVNEEMDEFYGSQDWKNFIVVNRDRVF